MSNDLIDLDVLIIGGGVQGLWLLNDLKEARYSAILLEQGELGGAQTCHSHVYIHQGCLYTEKTLAKGVRHVQPAWTHFRDRASISHVSESSIFGFETDVAAKARTNLWRTFGITVGPPSQSVLPSCLSGGTIKWGVESPEKCLDGTSLVEELGSAVRDSIGCVEAVDGFRTQVNPETVTGPNSVIVEEAYARVSGGARVTFRPKAVVLTAGAGNAGLLDLASRGERRIMSIAQTAAQIRKAHMLIVKGKQDQFDPLTGVFFLPDREFPGFSFFIVSRKRNGETIWLISDNRSPAVVYPEDWVEYSTKWWLPLALRSLKKLAPKYFNGNRPDTPDPSGQFKWGIYEAPKAEGKAGGSLPQEERIEQFWFKNLWAVWPTKLTLAPEVSKQILKKLRGKGIRPRPLASRSPAVGLTCPPAAPERWIKTPMTSWDEFRQCYL